MKLYFSKGACSLGVRITLHELGLKAEYISVNLKTKKTEKGEDFYQINPKGAVPALVTDDQQVLTENAVIQQFLAEHHSEKNLLPRADDFMHYRVLELLSYIASDVHKTFGGLFHPNIPEEVKQSIFVPLLKNKIEFLDKQLAQKKFLAGDHFTIPDSYFFVILTWLKHVNIDMNQWKNVSRYFNELKNRQSIQQALQEEELILA